MAIKTGYSQKPLPEAVEELCRQIGTGCNPRVVFYFGSSKYDPQTLSSQMQQAFAKATVVGCTTAGEIASGQSLNDSVVAMSIGEEEVADAGVAVIEDVASPNAVPDALAKLEAHFKCPVSSLDLQKHVGVILVDGLSGAEEKLMDKLGDCTDLFIVGGSAGDDLKFKRTYVFADGKAHSGAAVLVVLKLRNGFDVIKTQSFKLLGRQLVATRVDEAARRVIEFDHKPALAAYAEAIGVAPEKADTMFLKHPLGLMAGGAPFVRSPQRVGPEGSLFFYCNIKEGMELQVLDGTDMVADTNAILTAKKASGKIAGLIDFRCILRTLQLRQENRCKEYGEAFQGIPAIGFSTYGEQYLGHINQTSTMLLLR